MPSDRAWSDTEIDLIVADHFAMLSKELTGEPYSKTDHRRALLPLLRGRSEGSVERKHQNISAILIEARFPYINGYKPLSNYQAGLADAVLERLDDDGALQQVALAAVESPVSSPVVSDLLSRLTSPPALMESVRAALGEAQRRRSGRHVDYVARESANRDIGLAGEELVVRFERERLRALSLAGLAERVEHVSLTRGDGLGFDVLSFDREGGERYIEVKTTQFGRATPFYVTDSELSFSNENSRRFDLYRVYALRKDPHLFQLPGSIASSCELRPSQYSAYPR